MLGLQVEALFTHDADGRIRATNEPDGDPAPRLFLGRTREGNLWRLRHDLPEATARTLEELAADEPVRGDLRAQPRNLEAFRGALRRDGEVQSVDSGPAYRFPDELPLPATVVRLTPSSLHLLGRMVPDLGDVARQFGEREPWWAVIEDGVAVSLCCSSRLTERAAEAGLATLEGYRGRGHAAAVAAAWARAVRASGRTPLYSTSWGNAASRTVARKLGLVQYGADLSLE